MLLEMVQGLTHEEACDAEEAGLVKITTQFGLELLRSSVLNHYAVRSY